MSSPAAVTAQSYYEILGVPTNATAGEIRSSFISKAKTFHPDKRKREVEKLFNPQSEEAHNVDGAGDWDEMFSILSLAYSVLGNESSRAQYDLNLLTMTTEQKKLSLSTSLKKLRELQKRDAELQTSLMEETFALRRDCEEKKNGLVVIEAWYGPRYAVENPTRFANLVVNVIIQVQVLVDDKSRLIFPAGQSKTKVIPGLYLPPAADEFEPKALKLVYIFKRKLHMVVVGDEELLIAPLKTHFVAQKQLLVNNHQVKYQDDAHMVVAGAGELVVRSEAKHQLAPTTTTTTSYTPLGLARTLSSLIGITCILLTCVHRSRH